MTVNSKRGDNLATIEITLCRFLKHFGRLEEVELKALASEVEVKNYGVGEKLVDIGEIQPYFFLVVNGLVRKFLVNNDQEFILQFAKEGQIIVPLKSYCQEQPSDVAIETIEPCLIYAIHRSNLSSLSSTTPGIASLHESFLMYSLLQLEDIERDRLSNPGRARFVQFMKTNKELQQRVSQKHLASYLNIQPETFSRMKHLLKKYKISDG